MNCPHCESGNTTYHHTVKDYWCSSCRLWAADAGDPDEESRDEIASRENAVLDRDAA